MAAGSGVNGANGIIRANGSSKSGGSTVGDAGPTTIHVAQTHVLEWHVASYTVEGGGRAAGPGLLGGLRRERKTLLQGLGACGV